MLPRLPDPETVQGGLPRKARCRQSAKHLSTASYKNVYISLTGAGWFPCYAPIGTEFIFFGLSSPYFSSAYF